LCAAAFWRNKRIIKAKHTNELSIRVLLKLRYPGLNFFL